jgi:hypothetical protein
MKPFADRSDTFQLPATNALSTDIGQLTRQLQAEQAAGAPVDKAPSTDTPEDTIPWDVAVAEGKEIVARIKAAERDQLRLGELAHKVVHPKYGDQTFAKFAAKIGIDKNTLGHYRTTYRAWKDKLPPGAKFPSFAVLKELATVEDRAELLKAEPKMTKRRAEVHRILKDHPQRDEILSENPDLSASDAREFMSVEEAKEELADEELADDGSIHRSADEWPKDREDIREDGLLIETQVSALKDSVLQCSDEQLRDLAEPVWLETMEQAKADLTYILDRLNAALEAEADEAISEGDIRTTPAPASAPDQPEA